ERCQFARTARDLRTALARGRSKTGTTRAARLFLERGGVLSRETLGRSLLGISKSARSQRGRRHAAAVISPPSRTARRQALGSGDAARVSRDCVEKNGISTRAPGFGCATSTNAGSRSALGRADCSLDAAGGRRSAGTNRARDLGNAEVDSSLQALRIFHDQPGFR